VNKGEEIVVEFNGSWLVHHNLPNQQLDRHTHDEHQIFIPLSGRMRFTFVDQAVMNYRRVTPNIGAPDGISGDRYYASIEVR
jgi:hypothetical protein